MTNRLRALFFVLCAIFCASFAPAQTAVVVSPWPQFVSYLQNGQPNAFGCLFTYEISSTTPLPTYTDFSGATLNANPVILSAGGTASVWIAAGGRKKQIGDTAGRRKG